MTDQATMLSTAAGRMIGRLAQRRIEYRNLGDGPHSSTERLAASTTSRLSPHERTCKRTAATSPSGHLPTSLAAPLTSGIPQRMQM